MQNVRSRQASGQLAVDPDVEGIERVPDAHLRRDVVGSLVDLSVHGRMRVRIDQTRRDVLAPAVDFQRAGRRRQAASDRCDPSARDEEVGVRKRPARALSPDRRPADDDGGRRRDRSIFARREGTHVRRRRLLPLSLRELVRGASGPESPLFSSLRQNVPLAIDPDLDDLRVRCKRLSGRDDDIAILPASNAPSRSPRPS